jgi:uncharacterized protein YyaL (SSP411 family)
MNDLFINIKVDREERPEIDEIYMNALHLLGEQGGWPLTMFLTSKGEPVWGGTYFPRESRYGRPAFVDVLQAISRIFRDEPEKIDNNRKAILARPYVSPTCLTRRTAACAAHPSFPNAPSSSSFGAQANVPRMPAFSKPSSTRWNA